MKQYNITAQIYDLCKDPRQSLLYNQVITSDNIDNAKNQFEIELLVDDIVIQKILSIEEIV
jgi:hypothetical protein